MGRKATNLFFNAILSLGTILIAVFGILGWAGGKYSSPEEFSTISFLGIIMIPIMCLNIVALIYWVIKRNWIAVLPLIAITINAWVLSAALFNLRFQDVADEQNSIKIATYNIHGAAQQDFNFSLRSIANFFKDENVDIACLQEYIEKTKTPLDSISKHFKDMPHVAAHYNDKQDINLVIFSKYPIKNSSLSQFGNGGNGSLWADIDVNGKIVRVFNNHLQTTNINQSRKEIARIKGGTSSDDKAEALSVILERLRTNSLVRVKQGESIRTIIDTTRGSIIICGDFNDTPYSSIYRTMSNNLIDGFMECGKGLAYTYKPFKLFRLDYILYSKDIKGIKYSSPSLNWSDHNPVLQTIAFR